MKNETATRLTAAAGAFERALARLDRHPRQGDDIAVQKAGAALADALEAVAGGMDNRAEAGRIYRITDAYGEKAARYLTSAVALTANKAVLPNLNRSSQGDPFHDAANDMIVAARTIADRISRTGR